MLRRLAALVLICSAAPAGILVATKATATAAGSSVRSFLADFESSGDPTRANSSFWQAEMGTNAYNPDWKDNGGATAVPQSGAMSVRVLPDADGVPCYSGSRWIACRLRRVDDAASVISLPAFL